MASSSLISTINGYENYIERNGIDEAVIEAYIQALAVAFRSEHDIEYGLQLSAKVKSYIAQYVKNTTGGRVADLEVYAGENDTSCLLYTSPSPRDEDLSRMPSSA